MSTPVDRASGFKPLYKLSGGEIRPRKYYKSASVIIGVGDAVVLSGTAEATTGVAEVTRAAAGSGTITGVVVGRDPDRNDLQKRHMAAADTGYLLVVDDPDCVFEIQEDGDTSQIAVTDVGEFCDIIVADANTTSGQSVMELNSSDAGTGDQCRIHSRIEREDNDIGNVGTRWEVTINEHTYKSVQTPI